MTAETVLTPETKFFTALKLQHTEQTFKNLGFYVKSSIELGKQLETTIGSNAQEEIWAIYLDYQQNVIGASLCARGGIASCGIEPRQIFQHALLCNAAGIILCHNHPSGDTTPSCNDIKFSRRMVDACKLMGFELLDCMIIASDDYTSFAEKGFLK